MAGVTTYNTILVSGHPGGRFLGGIISGTPKPGTVMQIKSATEKVGGLFTYEVYNRDADGDRPKGPIFILLEKKLIGQGVDSAYSDGETGHLYVPEEGDEFLMRLLDVSGTGDTHAIGEILMIDDGTGKLIATTGTPETESFVCLETLAAPTADVLAHVQYAG